MIKKIALAFCLLSSLGVLSHGDQGKVFRAPEFEVVDLTGKKISLSGLQGKVVFLDFWATWCPPCVMSSPEVEKLVQEYTGKNVVVLSISLDNTDGPVRRFVASHKLTSRVALAGKSGIDGAYGVEGIPAYFVIDQKGNIARAWEGYNPSMTLMWRKEINQLLKK